MDALGDGVVAVRSLGDIKRAIHDFLPGPKEDNPVVHAEFPDGQGKKVAVSAPAGCTYRDMLMEGFEIVRKRLEAMSKRKDHYEGIEVQPIQIEAHMWLDDLITRRLGGKREGLRVRWDLAEGTYFFDPYSGKLTKECSDS